MRIPDLLLLSLCLPLPALAQDEGAHYDFERVRRALDEMVADGSAVGVVGRVERDGELMIEHAAGELGLERGAMRADSIARIFSMTKPVTAVAALTFWDEGRFQLDDPVSALLPAFADLRVKGARGEMLELERPLLVRDLFTHTSGWDYEVDWKRVARQQGEREPDLEAMVAALAELPLDFQPGSQWAYGISNDVLGAYVEALAEQPLDQVFEERIFAPLGMADTGFQVAREKLDRLAVLHYVNGNGPHPVPGWSTREAAERPALLEGGAGLYSTVGDYARFLRMLLQGGELDGERVLSEEAVALMTRDQIGDIPRSDTLRDREYGLGISITTSLFDMGTPGSWTWGGIAGTSFWIDPSTDSIAVFFVQNWMDFTPSIRFATAVASAFATPQREREDEPEDEAREEPSLRALGRERSLGIAVQN